MPPKRMYVDGTSRRAPKGFVASTYETLTSSENAAVVRSIAVFGVRSLTCILSLPQLAVT